MKHLLITPLLLATCINAVSVQAADVPSNPAQQTSWGLYIDSNEVAKMKQELGDKMLFIDVRDPIEIMFTGFTDVVDINIPFKTADPSTWHAEKPVFNMQLNKHFEQDISAALEARGLTKEAPIAIMCRSGGTRGAPATKFLEGKGYTNIYVVTDGFEGETLKEGDKKNWRLKDGWKNTGLPWSYSLNKAKMYLPTAATTTDASKLHQTADEKAKFQAMLHHVSPMPNYMSTLMANSDALNVSPEQKAELKKWISANNKKTAEVVKQIVELEAGVAAASLNGEDKETLMQKFDEMADLRLKIATSKTACRDNVRKILSAEQWDKLVVLQRAVMAK